LRGQHVLNKLRPDTIPRKNMRTRATIALVLAGCTLLAVAACEPENSEIIVPPAPILLDLDIAPDPVPSLTVGQTIQLVSIVAGTTTQTATWTSSNTSVASVNGTTGLVSAVAPGIVVITAVSTVDATARDAVVVRVLAGGSGPGPLGQPAISIKSIIEGTTETPVNPGNVAGRIVALLNVDIPAGVPAAAVRVLLNAVEVCRQAFSVTGNTGLDEVSASSIPIEIQCPINTAAVNADGTPLFMNGTLAGNNSVRAEVVDAQNTVLASATYPSIVLANVDVITASLTTTRGPVMAGGLAWRAGDVRVTLVPTIYSGAANRPTSLTVTLSAAGGAIVEDGVCNTVSGLVCGVVNETATDANAADGFTVVFSGTPAANGSTTFGVSTATPGVARIETPNITVGISGQVASGNPYIGNAIVNLGSVPLGPANALRLDNLAPRFTLLDITPATLNCLPAIACYINGAFLFAERAGFARTVDFGVDAQVTTFTAGPAQASLMTVQSGGQLPESPVAQTNLLAATSTDVIGNSRMVFATNVNTCVSHSSTSVAPASIQPTGDGSCAGVTAIQRFGIDVTPPTLLTIAGLPHNGANDGGVYTFSFIDVGGSPTAGPSGFSANPVSILFERILPSGTTCFGDAGAPNPDCALVADDGAVTLPATPGYFRLNAFATDQAGNVSTRLIRMTLIDVAPPVVGGIVAPSLITGGAAATMRAAATDNVELGDVNAAIGFEGLVTLSFETENVASYGPTPNFVSSTNIQYTVPQWIWSIETTTAAGRPTGTIFDADVVTFSVRDMAGVVDDVPCFVDGPNCDVTSQNIGPNVPEQPNSWTTLNPAFASANPLHGNFVLAAPSPSTLCNGGGNACDPVNQARSTNLTATVTGPSGTFANPFQRVRFYYIDTNGRAQLIGTDSPSGSDNTITSTRTWTFSTSWNVTGLVPANYQVFAIGIDSQGRALMTFMQTVIVEDQ
jgi:hypothetical protein